MSGTTGTNWFKYRGWFGRRAKRRCPHSHLLGIYGDDVNHIGGWRLMCDDCGQYLDGPVTLARTRTSNERVDEDEES